VILSKDWAEALPGATTDERESINIHVAKSDQRETSRIASFITLSKKYDGKFLAIGGMTPNIFIDF